MQTTDTNKPMMTGLAEAAISQALKSPPRKRRWGLYIFGFLLFLAACVVGGGYYFLSKKFIITVEATQIQSAVKDFFPKKQKVQLDNKQDGNKLNNLLGSLTALTSLVNAEVIVKEPIVSIPAEGNYIECHVKLNLKVDLLKEKEYPGTATVRSSVRYDDKAGAFYLKDPKVVKIDLPMIPKQIDGKIQSLVSLMLIKDVFDNMSVYQLKESWKERAAKLLLKKVDIHEGKIRAEVGL